MKSMGFECPTASQKTSGVIFLTSIQHQFDVSKTHNKIPKTRPLRAQNRLFFVLVLIRSISPKIPGGFRFAFELRRV